MIKINKLFLLFCLLSLSACSGIRPRQSAKQGLFQTDISDSINHTPRTPGVGLSVNGFAWPLKIGQISSYYGKRKRDFHDGLDISAPRGTAIYAAKEGTVIYSAKRIRGYGNMIVIKHKDNIFSVYAHNQKNLVRKNQFIKQGEHIANLGATGKATGPHLHFEVRTGQIPIDPLPYLPQSRMISQARK